MRLFLVGHMTVQIELDGCRLLTDPWFGPRGFVERWLAPRTLPPALRADDVGPLDALIVSHDHLDHFDDEAVRLARRIGCPVVGPPRVTRRAARGGVRETVTLRPGEEWRLRGLTVRAVHAEHPLAADAVGFVVAGTRVVYFSGDTRLVPQLLGDLEPFRIDVALVQAACAHYPLLGDDGMSLPQVLSLVRAVRPAWVVPLHLDCAGKWLDRARGRRIAAGGPEAVEAVVATLREWSSSLGAGGTGVRLLGVGETWEVPAEGAEA